MTLVKYNPSTKRTVFPTPFLNDFLNFEDFFPRDFGKTIGVDKALNSPSINIVEIDNGFKLEVAAPGLAKEDFNVILDEDHLIISAEQKIENEETKDKYTRREFNYSTFKRSFRLPENINRDEISAKYENGVLNITLIKLAEVETPETKKVIDIS